MKGTSSVLICILASTLAAQTTERATKPAGKAKEYVIQKGDLIMIDDFYRNPCSFPFRSQIREDGKITLSKYGDMLAAGKTIFQLNTDIRALASKDMKLPTNDWSVIVKDKNGLIHSNLPHAIY